MSFALAAVGVGLLFGGAIVKEQGRKKSLRDQADVEDANALFFAEQQEFVELQGRREISIFDDESETFVADKVSLIAQAGVDLSGNLLSILANESQKIAGEHNAILLQNEFRVKLAAQKVTSAQFNAKNLRDSADDNSSFFGSLLGVGGQTALAFSSSGSPDGGIGSGKVASSGAAAGGSSAFVGSHFGPRLQQGTQPNSLLIE